MAGASLSKKSLMNSIKFSLPWNLVKLANVCKVLAIKVKFLAAFSFGYSEMEKYYEINIILNISIKRSVNPITGCVRGISNETSASIQVFKLWSLANKIILLFWSSSKTDH